GRAETGAVDVCGGNLTAPCRIAELADECDVVERMDERELLDGGCSRREEVAELDQSRRFDQLDGELHSNRLQRMLVRQVMLHQRIAVDENHLSRHGHLR